MSELIGQRSMLSEHSAGLPITGGLDTRLLLRRSRYSTNDSGAIQPTLSPALARRHPAASALRSSPSTATGVGPEASIRSASAPSWSAERAAVRVGTATGRPSAFQAARVAALLKARSAVRPSGG